ncbi:NUT1 [[Candida] subhashii]|uniref:Mediator of RNA polymerase II transcription subunit 5 n=1 Tax=[Candida] subhashii TaxID=561895 RepID=A0A8J5UX05_9ASCO|nr:NUT1 [[Candida] subhashii]KAG7662074.1 NUT1 [[Candida] subhashii]
MTDQISLTKLITKSTNQKVSPRSFISLIDQFQSKQTNNKIDDQQYVSELLELNKINTTVKHQRFNEYKINLILELSLSSLLHCQQFWRCLGKLSDSMQIIYLSKVNKKLLHQYKKYDREIIRTLINQQFIQYCLDYLNKLHERTLIECQKLVVNQIIFFVGSIIDSFNKFLILKEDNPFQNFVIKLITILKNLKLGRLLSFLLLKTKSILTSGQIDHLIHSKIIKHEKDSFNFHHSFGEGTPTSPLKIEDGGEGEAELCTSSYLLSLSINNLAEEKQETYFITKRCFWFLKLMREFQFDRLDLLNSFIINLMPLSKQKNMYFVAYEFIKSLFIVWDLLQSQNESFVKFNLHNFIITRVPILLSNLKLNEEENVEKVVLDLFEAYPNANHDLKHQFVKSLIFHKCITTQSLPKFSDLNQQSIMHELQSHTQELNLRQKFNEKLLNINTEFTSLEESGLIQFINSLQISLEISYKRQQDLSTIILEIIDDLLIAKDHEKLNRLLLCLSNDVNILRIIVFNTKNTPFAILYKIIDFVDSEQFNIDDDDENFQDVYSYCGVAILSIILIVETFEIDLSKISIQNSFVIDYINNFYWRLCDNLTTQTPANNDEEGTIIAVNYNNLLTEWINALFDDNNEGLSDELIKSINIKQIYKLIPIVYQQAIIAANFNKIDFNILNNGLDYLSQVFLIPSTISLINWLLREIKLLTRLDVDNLQLKVLAEIIKSNTSGDSQDISTLIFKIVLNITGEKIITTLKKFKEWSINQTASEIIQIINNSLKKDNIIPTTSAFEKDMNVNETIKSQIISKQITDLDAQFVHNYITHQPDITINHLLQEIYAFQKSNNEEAKVFINLMISIMILYSIDSINDKEYWKSNLNTKIPPGIIVKPASEEVNQFQLSMDCHYSSIFSDTSDLPDNNNHNNNKNQSTENENDMNQFLKGDDEVDEDEDMMDDDDGLFSESKINKTISSTTTSEKLKQLTQAIHVNVNFLQEFRSIRDGINPIFHRSARILNDKLLDELNNLHI